jgi:hypothetical protein
LLRRDPNGELRLGMRLAALTGGTPEDPTQMEQALRILGQIPELDGHTVPSSRWWRGGNVVRHGVEYIDGSIDGGRAGILRYSHVW